MKRLLEIVRVVILVVMAGYDERAFDLKVKEE